MLIIILNYSILPDLIYYSCNICSYVYAHIFMSDGCECVAFRNELKYMNKRICRRAVGFLHGCEIVCKYLNIIRFIKRLEITNYTLHLFITQTVADRQMQNECVVLHPHIWFQTDSFCHRIAPCMNDIEAINS